MGIVNDCAIEEGVNYYEWIKQLAVDQGVSYRDLIVLAPQNDPFYVGTPADWEKGEWFAEVWRRAGYRSGAHLRRVHYWVVSQSPAVAMPDGAAYENTQKCWDYLVQASKAARYLQLVSIAHIVDKKNPPPHINAKYNDLSASYQIDVPDLKEPYVWVDGIEESAAQPYHLEVWCEKSTMNDVLLPVCGMYGANLVTFEGEVSITACHELIGRIEESGGKPARIFYISDFDPAGKSMPVATARKIEYMCRHRSLEYDVRLTPIVLTSEQVRRYRLPRIPIKETERRATTFQATFGQGAVELDALEALHPGRLAAIVEHALSPYYSEAAAAEVVAQKQALRQAVTEQTNEIASRYQAEIEALAKMVEELNAVDVDATEYDVSVYPAEAEEYDDWLFDSQRDYIEQMDAYKAFKAGSDS